MTNSTKAVVFQGLPSHVSCHKFSCPFRFGGTAAITFNDGTVVSPAQFADSQFQHLLHYLDSFRQPSSPGAAIRSLPTRRALWPTPRKVGFRSQAPSQAGYVTHVDHGYTLDFLSVVSNASAILSSEEGSVARRMG